MNVSVDWQGEMKFVGTSDSGHKITVDAGTAVGGHDEGARPMELIALGLAGCTAMDVISILKKKRQDVTGFQVEVHTENAANHPKVFTSIHIKYILHGRNIDPKAVARAMELSEMRYCPAQAMLSAVAPTTLSYEINESS